MSKAFDTVNILINKLMQINIPNSITKVNAHHIKGRKFIQLLEALHVYDARYKLAFHKAAFHTLQYIHLIHTYSS